MQKAAPDTSFYVTIFSLPSPMADDRLPLEDLNDDVIEIPPPSSTTVETTTEKRTLPPIYYEKPVSDAATD